MSVPTVIQSNQVPFLISTDNITYKSLVCNRTWGFNGTTAVNSEETDCGVFKGLGANDSSFDFEGVLNTTPNSPTEISAAEALAIWNNQTTAYVKVQTGAGTGSNIYIQAQGNITSITITKTVGNLLAFNGTFSVQGAVDITV